VSLLERIDQILQQRRWKQTDWSCAAGLKPNHLSVIVHRLRRQPDAGIDAHTAVALAKAAGVTAEWLTTGEGPGDADTIVLERDPLYPSRAIALAAAHLWEYPPAVTDRLRSISDFRTDPGLDHWIALLRHLYSEHLSRQGTRAS